MAQKGNKKVSVNDKQIEGVKSKGQSKTTKTVDNPKQVTQISDKMVRKDN